MPGEWYAQVSAQCRAHFETVLCQCQSQGGSGSGSGGGAGVDQVPPELRRAVAGRLFSLCLQQDSKRRFKMLLLDLLKVCYGEVSVDCLASSLD